MRIWRARRRTGALLCALALALPLAAATTPAHAAVSDLTYSRAQTFVAVDPGATASATATCPVGTIAINGSFQVDSDHTGRAADLGIGQNRRTGFRDWTATVSNGSPVRITGNVRVTCLGTTTAGGHVLGFGQGTASDPFGDLELDGFGNTTATCPAAQPVAVGAGWELTGGDAYLNASTSDGSSWTYSFEGAGATAVSSWVYCIDDGAVAGAEAVTIGLLPTAAVPPTSSLVADGSSWDATSSCPVDSLAVAGTFETLGAGVYHLGAESASRELRQRFYNDSGASSTVTTDVVCLASAAVPPPPRTITEDNDKVNKRVIAGKTFLAARVTCSNFPASCGTVVAKAFVQNSDGSRGPRVATGKVRYSGPATPMRLEVSRTDLVPGAAVDALVLVLAAGGTTTVTKDVDVEVP